MADHISPEHRSWNMQQIKGKDTKIEVQVRSWLFSRGFRFRKNEKEWDYYSFRGSKWQHRKQAEQKRYLVNAYRVLLTRARQGMIIFVPKGVDEEEDPTRNSTYYDAIYEYLLKCGIEEK